MQLFGSTRLWSAVIGALGTLAFVAEPSTLSAAPGDESSRPAPKSSRRDATGAERGKTARTTTGSTGASPAPATSVGDALESSKSTSHASSARVARAYITDVSVAAGAAGIERAGRRILEGAKSVPPSPELPVVVVAISSATRSTARFTDNAALSKFLDALSPAGTSRPGPGIVAAIDELRALGPVPCAAIQLIASGQYLRTKELDDAERALDRLLRDRASVGEETWFVIDRASGASKALAARLGEHHPDCVVDAAGFGVVETRISLAIARTTTSLDPCATPNLVARFDVAVAMDRDGRASPASAEFGMQALASIEGLGGETKIPLHGGDNAIELRVPVDRARPFELGELRARVVPTLPRPRMLGGRLVVFALAASETVVPLPGPVLPKLRARFHAAIEPGPSVWIDASTGRFRVPLEVVLRGEIASGSCWAEPVELRISSDSPGVALTGGGISFSVAKPGEYRGTAIAELSAGPDVPCTVAPPVFQLECDAPAWLDIESLTAVIERPIAPPAELEIVIAARRTVVEQVEHVDLERGLSRVDARVEFDSSDTPELASAIELGIDPGAATEETGQAAPVTDFRVDRSSGTAERRASSRTLKFSFVTDLGPEPGKTSTIRFRASGRARSGCLVVRPCDIELVVAAPEPVVIGGEIERVERVSGVLEGMHRHRFEIGGRIAATGPASAALLEAIEARVFIEGPTLAGSTAQVRVGVPMTLRAEVPVVSWTADLGTEREIGVETLAKYAPGRVRIGAARVRLTADAPMKVMLWLGSVLAAAIALVFGAYRMWSRGLHPAPLDTAATVDPTLGDRGDEGGLDGVPGLDPNDATARELDLAAELSLEPRGASESERVDELEVSNLERVVLILVAVLAIGSSGCKSLDRTVSELLGREEIVSEPRIGWEPAAPRVSRSEGRDVEVAVIDESGGDLSASKLEDGIRAALESRGYAAIDGPTSSGIRLVVTLRGLAHAETKGRFVARSSGLGGIRGAWVAYELDASERQRLFGTVDGHPGAAAGPSRDETPFEDALEHRLIVDVALGEPRVAVQVALDAQGREVPKPDFADPGLAASASLVVKTHDARLFSLDICAEREDTARDAVIGELFERASRAIVDAFPRLSSGGG
jgi:hypothetical protein